MKPISRNFRFLPLVLALAATPGLAGQAMLNAKDADIRALIEQVSKVTGKTFVLDPRVQGQRITVVSQHMMDEREVYDTFLSVLRVHGFAAIEANGVVKIVQDQIARTEPVPVYKEGGRRYYSDELITRVVKVNHVDVQQLNPVVRIMVSQQGHLAPYARTNVLVVHDSAANVERIVEIIRQVDKASEEEIEVIALKHASAEDVVRMLELLDKQGQKPEDMINRPKVAPDPRTNSILVSAEGAARLRLRALIAQLDQPVASGGNTKVIYLHYAKAEDMVETLTGVSKQIAKQEDGKKAANNAPRNNENFSIEAHKDTNALVITAPLDMMRSLENVIRQLDIRRAQVHLEAFIVEISDNDAKQLGVQWLFGEKGQPAGMINYNNAGPGIGELAGAAAVAKEANSGKTTIRNPTTGTIETVENPRNTQALGALGSLLGKIQGIGIGAGKFRDDGFSWGAFVQAVATAQDSNVLSTPSLTTMDNEEASLLVGQEIPFITGSEKRPGSGSNDNPFNTVDRKEVGIKLKVKPRINEGNAVALTIEQEVSGLAGTTSVDVVTNKRQIKTTVLADDGEVIVLGGLMDDQVQQSESKVPLLGDIPLLGHLFRSQGSTKVKRNLLVFIRPTIVRDGDNTTMRALSSRKYQALRDAQLQAQEKGVRLMPNTQTAVLPELNQPAPSEAQEPATRASDAEKK